MGFLSIDTLGLLGEQLALGEYLGSLGIVLQMGSMAGKSGDKIIVANLYVFPERYCGNTDLDFFACRVSDKDAPVRILATSFNTCISKV